MILATGHFEGPISRRATWRAWRGKRTKRRIIKGFKEDLVHISLFSTGEDDIRPSTYNEHPPKKDLQKGFFSS